MKRSPAILAAYLPLALGKIVCFPVQSTSGLVHGHPGSLRPEVSVYLGIRYATPPTGDLRFAAPVEYSSNDTIPGNSYVGTVGTEYPSPTKIQTEQNRTCPGADVFMPPYPDATPQFQTIMKAFLVPLGPKSEDCLYLNVWTKPEPPKLKPVLLWIHGGRFEVSGAHGPYYDGESLAADHDVVVVTINYRLNIFGFSGAPGLPQNVGLLDQRMAVEWVHQNIKAFGGDPDRITIFGSSAGGASVDLYAYAWADDPIISGIIAHSGTALSFQPNTPDLSLEAFYNASSFLGCEHEEDPGKVVACVREKPFEDVLNASFRVPDRPSLATSEPVFHPVIDGVTVFSKYLKRSALGKFAAIPFLVTCNNHETGIYRVTSYAENVTLSDHAWNEFQKAAFDCPSGRAARDRTAHGIPAWQSRYFGDWDNLRLYPTSGAYHASDLGMVFGTAAGISGIPNSAQENKVSSYMASAWAAFAHDPKEGLTNFGWPQYGSTEKCLVGLAYENEIHPRFFDPAEFEHGCAALHGDTSLGTGAI
ncbi:hypothetical protein N7468_002975 [Penicillium chermesinum]|uniref:Carboxylic ester hydrolase n=1 Tax=Penicillium chermesinum TaxID=63820 RepID=A0A9W9TR65_9EURO|nr:uncharacterized protein N7468_002975 [Penicillium chermesinum]KAJ5238356.1 hypothetical protein N7468_002975 [Penicillium chermesinum]KAJ6164023.1 hypothetical protein N7470_002695 [Penicillium chermesinum]